MQNLTYSQLCEKWYDHWFAELNSEGLLEWIEDGFNYLYENPNLTWKSIQSLITRYPREISYLGQIKTSNYCSKDAWEAYSRNPNITLDILVNNPQHPWDWKEFSSNNPNASLTLAKQHPEHPWCWISLCRNQNVTPEEVIQYPDLDWDFQWLSYHKKTTPKLVYQFPDANWDWSTLAGHSNFSEADVMSHPKLRAMETSWCYNPNISLSTLKKTLGWTDINVDRLAELTLNRHLKGVKPQEDGFARTYFSQYPQELVSRMTLENFVNPNLSFSYSVCDDNITWIFPSHSRLTQALITCPSFKQKMIEYAGRVPKRTYPPNKLAIWLTKQPFITFADIQNHPEVDWHMRCFALNPNMSWNWLRSQINDILGSETSQGYWIKQEISKNHMGGEKERWISHYRLRHIKALQIQRHWRRCSYDPSFKLGDRLVQERATLDE